MDINEEARQLRARMDRERAEAEALRLEEVSIERKRQEELLAHARKVRTHIKRFRRWARRWRIPYDEFPRGLAHKKRFLGETMWEQARVWLVANHTWTMEFDDSDGPGTHTVTHSEDYVLTRKEVIHRNLTYDTIAKTYILSPPLDDRELGNISIESIERNIVRLSATYNIPWDE